MLANRKPHAFRVSLMLGALHQLVLATVGCATPKAAPITPSEIVLGSKGAYSLFLMTAGWTRVARQANDEDGSDLVLSNTKTGVTAIVNLHLQPEQSLDGVVFGRREELSKSNEILGFEEERYLLEQSTFIPVSVVRYRLRGNPAAGWFLLIVGTARGPDSIVEILAIGGHPAQLDGLFKDVLTGLRIPAGSGASP